MNIGYIRASTDSQITDRQHDILNKYQLDRIYEEKLSGKNMNRPELQKMLDMVREGDVIYIESLSRLGRNTRDLLEIMEGLAGAGVNVISHKENIDMNTPAGRMMLTVMAAMAEFERETIAERTREGLASARARGKVGGRPKIKEKTRDTAYKMYESNIAISEICNTLKIGKSTLYNIINEKRAGINVNT